jgi:hypothetical protein
VTISFTRFRGARVSGPRTAFTFGRWNATTSGRYFTDFDATENPISENSRWVRGGTEGGSWTNPRTSGGLCYGTQTFAYGEYAADDSVAHLTGFEANHRVRIVMRKTGSSFNAQEVEAWLRTTITSGSLKGYEINVEQSGLYMQCWQWLGGFDNTSPRQPSAFVKEITSALPSVEIVDGTVLEAQISGNTITAWLDGVQQFTANVETFASSNDYEYLTTGNPGIGFYAHDRPNTDDFCAKSFEAWNI